MLTRYLPHSLVTKRLPTGKIVSPFQTLNLVDDFEALTYVYTYTRDIRSDLFQSRFVHCDPVTSLTRNLTKKMSPGRLKRDEAKSKEQREIVQYRRIRI